MKIRKIMVAFLTLLLLAAGTIGDVVKIQAATEPPAVVVTEDIDLVVTPGETSHIKIPVKAANRYIVLPTIEVKAEAGAPFKFSPAKLSMLGSKVGGIAPGEVSTDLEFDVTVKETAKIKNYPIDIILTYDDEATGEVDKQFKLSTTIKVQEEKDPSQLTVSNVKLGNTNVGSQTSISFTVKNEGEITAKSAYLNMNYGTIIEERYTAKDVKIGDLASGETKDITLPITILSTASVGRNTLVANFTYKTVDGDEIKDTYNVSINLSSNISAPKLKVDDVKFAEGLKPGDNFTLSVALANSGEGTAKDIVASLDPASISKDGVIKNYYTDGINVSDIKKNKNKTVEIPLSVSKYATGGLKEVKIVVTYHDEANVAYTLTNTVYIDVTGEATAATPDIIISGVKQTPDQPVAGGNLEVSFDVENKSSVDINELKISLDGLTGSTFIPVESEPYQYIEKLKAGEKVRVTIPLEVSESIPEGLNNLSLSLKYTGSSDASPVTIPIHNVINELGSNSKPKLIVSKYTTDVEELRAGSTFNFNFDIYNTNSSVAAKNITVTVSQAENMFTPTQGSNSFFINKLAPGETASNTLEMKVKSDAVTKAYPVEILIEYEYDGAKPNPTTGEIGESRKETLNLMAVENSRPEVNYVNVYSYDGNITVGGQATLAFEFYNMGRSPLNNVIARLEGDGFTKTDGDMYFIGNVQPGSSSYVEFPVTANMEGTASGVLKITFEDSNGEEIPYTKEFSQEVMPTQVIDPGMMNPGAGEVFNPQVPIAKKAILPTWLFIIIQVVIFILFVPITRKIIISVYKAKLRKKEQEQY